LSLIILGVVQLAGPIPAQLIPQGPRQMGRYWVTMDPIKAKLPADLSVVLRELVQAVRAAVRRKMEAFCASAKGQSRNDADLCYFHLN